jgi:hypothetical protein
MVLLIVEVLPVINGDALSGVSKVLLWVGVGLVALGGLLLVLTVWQSEREPAVPAGEAPAADDAPAAEVPAAGAAPADGGVPAAGDLPSGAEPG